VVERSDTTGHVKYIVLTILFSPRTPRLRVKPLSIE